MFARDSETTALVATNAMERDKYRLERRRNKDFKALQAEVEALKVQLAEINTVVAKLLEEKK